MIDKVLQYIKREKLITEHDTVLVGLSGGADSVCLLCVLANLKECLHFSLQAVHIEHGIRGEESREDAYFAEQLCEGKGIPIQVYHVDVPKSAKERGLGFEETARILRYECFEEAAGCVSGTNKNPVKIALAHHAEDNAETVLFQMVRGSGLDGLCGMQPKRKLNDEAEIIRPLLKNTRGEIEQHLEEIGQAYCVDSTNKDTDYSRNRIRHNVIPELVQVNQKAVAHINQSTEILMELKEFLDKQVDEVVQNACMKSNGKVLLKEKELQNQPQILRKEVVHRAICLAAGSAKDITMTHVESVAKLLGLQVGRRISLPYGLVAERVYDGVLLKKVSVVQNESESVVESETEEATFSLMIKKEQLEDGTPIFFEVPGGRIRLQVLDFSGDMEQISKKTYTKWLNYDKIIDSLQIRNRLSGDYLILDKEGHKKLLKEYFINEKIPSEKRSKILLLTSDSQVIWVFGRRISADYKIDESTKRILEVQFYGGILENED